MYAYLNSCTTIQPGFLLLFIWLNDSENLYLRNWTRTSYNTSSLTAYRCFWILHKAIQVNS